MKCLFILPLIIFLASPAFAASAETPVFGTYKIDCPASSDTYIGLSISRPSAFAGEVEGVAENGAVVASGEPNWAENRFVYESGSQSDHYYLKFTSGELEGAWFDIVGNSSYSVEIDIPDSELKKIALGDSFEIIPHWTLSTLFPDGGGLAVAQSSFSRAGASIVRTYAYFDESEGWIYPDGCNNAPSKSYFFRQSKNSWLDYSNKNASDAVLAPNSVVKITQEEGVNSTATFSGVVPNCATAVEIFAFADSGAQDIYISNPSATDITLSELTDPLVKSGAFSHYTLTISKGDELTIYSTNEVNAVSDKRFLCKKSGETYRWVKYGTTTSADDTVVKAGASIILRKKAQAEDFAARATFSPQYLNK